MNNAVDALTLVVAVAALLVAIAAVAIPWRVQYDDNLLKQAISSMERAFNVLTDDGRQISPPPAHRLNWATSARHLESYRSIKKRFKTRLGRHLRDEHEEFWRHKFYVALRTPHPLHPGYFLGPTSPTGRNDEKIIGRSAVIVYSFSKWGSKEDRLDSADIVQLVADYGTLNGNPGLRIHLERHEPDLYAQIRTALPNA